jgi:hypothetical protein
VDGVMAANSPDDLSSAADNGPRPEVLFRAFQELNNVSVTNLLN